MAIIIIGILLTQVYNLGVTLGQEGENSMMLVDRLYYLRKDSEYVFWQTALSPEETRMDAIQNWANSTEMGRDSLMGQDSIQVASWLGERHTAARVFQGAFLPAGCQGPSCGRKIPEANQFQALIGAPRGCIRISIQSAGTSIYLESPRAASLFSVTGGDYGCPG